MHRWYTILLYHWVIAIMLSTSSLSSEAMLSCNMDSCNNSDVTNVNVSCGELNSMNELKVNFDCCLLYMYGTPILHIRDSYDGGKSMILEHNSGCSSVNCNRILYSSVSTVRLMNSTRIWCSITNHSTSPPTRTTCKHHMFTNICQDQGFNNSTEPVGTGITPAVTKGIRNSHQSLSAPVLTLLLGGTLHALWIIIRS